MKTDERKHPMHCGCCNKSMKIPLVRSGVFICRACDGWPPILDPPGMPVKREAPDDQLADPRTGHRQGCGAAFDPQKRCICPPT